MIFIFDCAVCGQRVKKYRSPGNLRGQQPRFCGKACAAKARIGSGPGRALDVTFTCLTCGETASVYRGPKKRDSVKYCSVACMNVAHRGDGNPKKPSGAVRRHKDYVYVYRPDHPDAEKDGYILEHRLVAGDAAGRRLLSAEIVHHINGIRGDNRPENLKILPNQSAHLKLHRAEGTVCP